jgi:hypothetical protein
MMKASQLLGSGFSIAALALLAACGGGGGGGGSTPPVSSGGPPPSTSTPAPTATPTATPTPSSGSLSVSSTVYNAYDGTSWGADNWQTNGVTTGDKGDGDAVNNVGSGQSTDGLNACALSSESQMTSNNYHVHAFVGIYVNGSPMAIPDAIGMANPSSDEPITNFSCAYSIHTHSASGIIHVEDPAITGTYANTAPPLQYNLQALMDIWGQSLTNLAGGTGLPAIYVGTPSGKTASGEDLVTSYSLYTGTTTGLLLAHHKAIWLIYGAPPTGGVPQVAFGISN